MTVQRAKRACDEAEDKLRVIKQWNREFDNRVEPLVKQMEKLHTVLAHDMVQAVAFLTQAIDTLHAYAEIAAPSRVRPPPRRASGSPPAEAAPASEAAADASGSGQAMKASGTRLSGDHPGTVGPVAADQDVLEGRQRSQEFEHRYMEELSASVDRTVTVIDQLDKLVNQSQEGL